MGEQSRGRPTWNEDLASYEIVIFDFDKDGEETFAIGAKSFDEAQEIIKSYLLSTVTDFYIRSIRQTGWLILKAWEPDNSKISPLPDSS